MSEVKHAVPFCPSGPSDVHVHWLVNGRSLATPVREHRQPVGPSRVLVSSWLREGPLVKDARYGCVAQAETGSDASEVDLRLTVGGTWTRCGDGECTAPSDILEVEENKIGVGSMRAVVVWQMSRAFRPGT